MLGSGPYNCYKPPAFRSLVSSLRIAAGWGWPQAQEHPIVSGFGRWGKPPMWVFEKHKSSAADKPCCPQVHTHSQHSPAPCERPDLPKRTQSLHGGSPTHSATAPHSPPAPCAHPAGSSRLSCQAAENPVINLCRPTSCLRACCWVGPVSRVGCLPWLSWIKSVL